MATNSVMTSDTTNNDLPPIVQKFYTKYKYLNETNEIVKIEASCNKCAKVIKCAWKPTKVTSNFISHIKVGLFSQTFINSVQHLSIVDEF